MAESFVNILYALSGISGFGLLAFILRYFTPIGICSLNCIIFWYKCCWRCCLCYFHNLKPKAESHLDTHKTRAHYKVVEDRISFESDFTGKDKSPKKVIGDQPLEAYKPLKKPNNFPYSTVQVEKHY